MLSTSFTRLSLALALGALLLTGCSGGSSSGGSASTVAATTSADATAQNSQGGNASSGSVSSGATASGFGAGSGHFVDASSLLPQTASADYGADVGDLDGDGDVDVVIAVMNDASRILLNDGQGGFSLGAGLPNLTMRATDVRLIDADRDGDFDLIFAANFEPARLFLNDGMGSFTLAAEIDAGNDAFVNKLAIGDANGDGWDDVFFARSGQATGSRGQNRLFLNDQAGGFYQAPSGTLPVKYDDSVDATFLDLTGDGHLDIFVANSNGVSTLLTNDQAGAFVDQSDVYVPLTISRYATSVAHGDLDLDGDVDLFVGTKGAPSASSPAVGERNLWLANEGEGVALADAMNFVPDDAEPTGQLRLVDVNGDGWLDVVASQERARQRLYLNMQGQLVDASSFLPNNTASSSCQGVVVGDFNGDQAPDLLFLRRGAAPWMFLNTP